MPYSTKAWKLVLVKILNEKEIANDIAKARSRKKSGPFSKTKQKLEVKSYLLPSRGKEFVAGESDFSISHWRKPETPLEPSGHRGCIEGN